MQTDVLAHIDLAMELYYKNRWQLDLNRESAKRGTGRNKLRTYILIKNDFQTDEYLLNMYITRGQRSNLAKFRCGVAPLCLETGWYEGLSEEERICPVFNTNTFESQYHAIMSCQLYYGFREVHLTCAMSCNDDFYHMSNNDKYVFMMSDNNLIAKTAGASQSILYRRLFLIYTNIHTYN